MAPINRYIESQKAENLNNALRAISDGMSQREASRQFRIPRGTLYDKINRRYREGKRRGSDPFLSEEEEKVLVGWVRAGVKRGLPPHRKDLLNTVQRLMKETQRENPFVNDRPGRKWFEGFMRRNPNLSIRTPERVSRARSRITEASINEWFNNLDKTLTEMNHRDVLDDPTRIFNSDETCIQLCPKTGKVIGVKGWKNIYELSPGPEKSNLTFLGTFRADGEIVAPLIVYPYLRIPNDIATAVPSEIYMASSESGWMRSETFYEFVANPCSRYLEDNAVKKPVISN